MPLIKKKKYLYGQTYRIYDKLYIQFSGYILEFLSVFFDHLVMLSNNVSCERK